MDLALLLITPNKHSASAENREFEVCDIFVDATLIAFEYQKFPIAATLLVVIIGNLSYGAYFEMFYSS